jgi:hypothetical protein
VLECGVGCSDEGLGLVDTGVTGENLLQPGALFINALGDFMMHVNIHMTFDSRVSHAFV